MKIIKEGNLNKYAYQGTCRNCGCMIEAEQSETKCTYDPRDQVNGLYVHCPTKGCGHIIHVSRVQK